MPYTISLCFLLCCLLYKIPFQKRFHDLHSKAETLKIEISNPSPSGDEYFTDSDNLAEIEKRAKAYKESKGKDKITLRSAEEITNFINNL